jgi:hypothetical protein
VVQGNQLDPDQGKRIELLPVGVKVEYVAKRLVVIQIETVSIARHIQTPR